MTITAARQNTLRAMSEAQLLETAARGNNPSAMLWEQEEGKFAHQLLMARNVGAALGVGPVETAVGIHAGQAPDAIPELIQACREFCSRVEAGEVRSVRTYAKFKVLLARIDGGK